MYWSQELEYKWFLIKCKLHVLIFYWTSILGKNEVLWSCVRHELVNLFGPIMSELDLSCFVYLVPLGQSWPSSLVWSRWKPNFINDMKKRKWSQKWVSIIRYQIILSLIARVECRQCLNLIWHLSWCLLCI